MTKQKRLKYDKVAAFPRSVNCQPITRGDSETTRVLELSHAVQF